MVTVGFEWGGGGLRLNINFEWFHLNVGARCSSVVRAFAHGAIGHQIDPSISRSSQCPRLV